jgi:hypothetical protein
MASRALAFSPQPQPTDVAHAMLLVEEITQPRVVTNVPPPPVYMIETGLRAGIKLKFTPDKRGEFPTSVAKAVEEVRQLERLPRGWDSYDAAPLDDGAVVAAFELIIHAESKCDAPIRLVPLSNGGLGLRWVAEGAELEVDVDPNGTCEATLEGPAVGNSVELLAGSSLGDVKELISRHASLR